MISQGHPLRILYCEDFFTRIAYDSMILSVKIKFVTGEYLPVLPGIMYDGGSCQEYNGILVGG